MHGFESVGSVGMKIRLIREEESEPVLEFLEAAPAGMHSGTPILLIHGAFGGAWMWQETFVPHLAGNGRHVAAVSLRGHGGSGGRERLHEATLDDYARDVRRALAEFSQAPIVIAHSLGALLAQRLLGQERIRALVMLAPLPPEGMLLLGPILLATQRDLWLETVNALLGSAAPPLDHAKQVIFSDRFSREDVNRYLSLMVVEGPRVLIEAHVPQPTLPAFFLGIPSLVIGAGDDPLVGRGATWRTAIYHGSDHVVANGRGHLLHFEPGAERVAELVLDWIEKKGL